MRVFGVLGRALVRWPDARAELRQARVARRFNMMLFGCHASFGQLGQRRGQLEFICDDAKITLCRYFSPPFYSLYRSQRGP